MVRFNATSLVDRETPGSASGTWQEDLPETGGLTGLDLILRATNGATSNVEGWITDIITKLEIIVNGDDRKFSLTGRECLLHPWVKGGNPSHIFMSEVGSAVQEWHIPIRFGRYLGDPEFGMDLKKYANAKISLEYNHAAVNAVGATGFAANNLEVSVIGHITDPAKTPTYKGLIRTKELKTFTTAATGDEWVKLENVGPMLGFGVYCREAGVAPEANITNVRLSLDRDTKQPYRGRWEFFANRNYSDLVNSYLSYQLAIAAADVKNLHFGRVKSIISNGLFLTPTTTVGDSTMFAGFTKGAGDAITCAGSMITMDTDASPTVVGKALTISTFDALVEGMPSHYIWQPIGDSQLLADMLQPSEYAEAHVVCTQGNAGATCGIVVENVLPQ